MLARGNEEEKKAMKERKREGSNKREMSEGVKKRIREGGYEEEKE